MLRRNTNVALIICLGLAAAGCSDKQEKVQTGPAAQDAPARAGEPSTQASASPAPAPDPASPVEPAPEPSAAKLAPETGIAALERTGVVECDNYLMRFEFCLSRKVPEAHVKPMKAGLETMAEAWKKAAATEAGQAALPVACEMALDAAVKSMAAFECDFERSTLVLACDRYLMKYSGCLNDKVPDEHKAPMKEGIKNMLQAWRQAASTDEGKRGLKNACLMAEDAARKSMSQFGCDW